MANDDLSIQEMARLLERQRKELQKLDELRMEMAELQSALRLSQMHVKEWQKKYKQLEQQSKKQTPPQEDDDSRCNPV